MITKLARMLAALTLVVWLETTTAPDTITTPFTVVSTTINTNRIGGGVQPSIKYRPVK